MLPDFSYALSNFQHHYQVTLNRSVIGESWQTLQIKDAHYVFQQTLNMSMLWKKINIIEISEGEIKNNLLKATHYEKNENGKKKFIDDFSKAQYDQLSCQLALQIILENKVPQQFECRYTNGKKIKTRRFILSEDKERILATDARYMFIYQKNPLTLIQIEDQQSNFGQLRMQLQDKK